MNNFPYTPLQLAWIAAMKDGSHKWVANALGKFIDGVIVGNCCLGVACDVLGIPPEFIPYPDAVVYGGSITAIPFGRWKELGLRDEIGRFSNGITIIFHRSLLSVNDFSTAKLGYAPVLDILENHPEWVFTNLD